MTHDLSEKMHRIIAAIKAAGHDPYSQLYGYLKTGDSAYITRSGGARELIGQLDKEQVRQYVESVLKQQVKAASAPQPTDS